MEREKRKWLRVRCSTYTLERMPILRFFVRHRAPRNKAIQWWKAPMVTVPRVRGSNNFQPNVLLKQPTWESRVPPPGLALQACYLAEFGILPLIREGSSYSHHDVVLTSMTKVSHALHMHGVLSRLLQRANYIHWWCGRKPELSKSCQQWSHRESPMKQVSQLVRGSNSMDRGSSTCQALKVLADPENLQQPAFASSPPNTPWDIRPNQVKFRGNPNEKATSSLFQMLSFVFLSASRSRPCVNLHPPPRHSGCLSFILPLSCQLIH